MDLDDASKTISADLLEHCGLVAIIGRPNVGKSTFLNAIVGQKISITSRRPQTTRFRILGVKTTKTSQVVFIDTPGMQIRPRRALNKSMNDEVRRALDDVDAVLFFVQAGEWNEADEFVYQQISSTSTTCCMVVNQIDRLRRRSDLLPFLKRMAAVGEFADTFLVSAKTGENLAVLEAELTAKMPSGPALFPADQLTDKSMRFVAGEILREKLLEKLGEELPYSLSVLVDEFEEGDAAARIGMTIWVERAGQKRIVIGKDGRVLKSVGEETRLELEKSLEKKVHLTTWVKVKRKWADDSQALNQLGFE